MSGHEGPGDLRERRRARWLITATVVILLLGTGFAVILTRLDRGSPPGGQAPQPVATVSVVKTTLVDEDTSAGTLGYGNDISFAGRKSGTITSLPQIGGQLTRGRQVYGVDAKPVPLFYGTVPFYRDLALGADDGPDVAELEQNLRALGFDGFGRPDTKFTAATANSLKAWQKSLGLPRTGTFGQGDTVLAPGAVRVSSLTAQLGAPAMGDLMKASGTDHVILAKLDVAKQSLAKVGDKVKLDISGAGTTTGTIRSVGASVSTDKDSDKTTFDVIITLDDPGAAGTFDSAPVTVHFTKGKHENVLAVPVGALLALAEGGYAVETDDRGAQHLVAVKTGLFSGGLVEVAGTGLREGLTVVTTS
jgi:peptidoglycan hydrolase-like protein with peptidoglycan-binding domain